MERMFEIRKASVEDIAVIRSLASVVFPDTYKEILSPEQLEYMMEWMYSADSLNRQMTEDGHIYYLAYHAIEPVGYLSIQPEEEHTFHLQKIYVLPSFQGRGLGKLLFEQAIRTIKELHPSPCQMRLNVNRRNKALAFYQKMGMKKIDEGDFPIGNGFYMNDFIMGLDIYRFG